MKLHYKTHFIEQEADGFRPYFHALKALPLVQTAQEALDALDREARLLAAQRAKLTGENNVKSN